MARGMDDDLARASTELQHALERFTQALSQPRPRRRAAAQAGPQSAAASEPPQAAAPAEAAAPPSPVFTALRAWRMEQARARAVPPYIIASDALLHAVAQAHPTDLAGLEAIPGMGRRAVTYGTQMLEVLAKTA